LHCHRTRISGVSGGTCDPTRCRAVRDDSGDDRNDRLPVLLEELLQSAEEVPTRIGEAERIVQHVGIPIVRLRVERELDVGIGAKEPPNRRVIDAAIHVHEPEIVEDRVIDIAVPQPPVADDPASAARVP